MAKTQLPVGKIIRLVTKTIRLSKGGFTRAERRDLGLDLLMLAAHVLEGVDLDDKQEGLFDAVVGPDAE
jgi:hypothetical protein